VLWWLPALWPKAARMPHIDWHTAGQANQSGEDQKKLDVLANDVFVNVLRNTKKVWYGMAAAVVSISYSLLQL
jgi:fructose-1,6-bisphosphatase